MKPFLTVTFLMCLMLNLPLGAIAAENSFIKDSARNKNEHVVWNKLPITFVVPVNQERLISFPGQIQVVNANESLTKVKVNILNNAGTLYIKAHSTFDPVRLRVILKETGEVILLDLSAVNVGNDNPVDVVLASNITNEKNSIEDERSTNNVAANVVSLTRYGIQQLYSPARLLEANSTFYRTPMYANKTVSFYYGDSINAFPLISWRGGDLYVTAVLLRNRLSEQVVVDPNSFTGCWKSISFYPSGQLQVKGSQHDRATAFVVSTSPFGDALTGQCVVAR